MISLLSTISSDLDIVYLDIQKAFYKTPHNKLIFKVKQLGITDNVHNWIENWLSNRKQRVAINGSTSDWASVTSGVSQCSVLGPALFTICMNNIDIGLNSFIAKFADDKKSETRYSQTATGKASKKFCPKSQHGLIVGNAFQR